MHYRAPSFAGTVIDAETEEPIQGAVVLAMWHQKDNQILAFGKCSPKVVKEYVTNEDGSYTINDWFQFREIFGCRITSSSPRIYVIKKGYEFFVTGNNTSFDSFKFYLTANRPSKFDDKIVKLKKDNRPLDYQAKEFYLYSYLTSPFLIEECNPLKIYAPNTIYEAEKIRITVLPYLMDQRRLSHYSPSSSYWCS